MRIILAATIGAAALAGPPPAQVAQQICASLPQLGAQCLQQMTPTAQTIVDGCSAKAQPETDAFRQCVQAGIATAVQQAGGGTAAPVAPSAERVAGDICGDLQTAFGAGFSARFGTGCASKLAGTAQLIIARCTSVQQPGTDAFAQCMEGGIDAAVTTRTIAKRICTGARSPVACEAKVLSTAAHIRASCAGNAGCVAKAVTAAARKQKGR